jgi:DNA-binding response OmpR family regulator
MPKPILVVDDAGKSLAELAQALAESGYSPTRVAAGAIAVEHFAASRPELVFVSLALPEPLTICEGIRSDPDGAIVPIVLVGRDHPDVRSPADALNQGADFYFELPLDRAKMLAKVQTYIGRGDKTPSVVTVVGEAPPEVAPPPDAPDAPASAPPSPLTRSADALLAVIQAQEADLAAGPPTTPAPEAPSAADEQERKQAREATRRIAEDAARRVAEQEARRQADEQAAGELERQAHDQEVARRDAEALRDALEAERREAAAEAQDSAAGAAPAAAKPPPADRSPPDPERRDPAAPPTEPRRDAAASPNAPRRDPAAPPTEPHRDPAASPTAPRRDPAAPPTEPHRDPAAPATAPHLDPAAPAAAPHRDPAAPATDPHRDDSPHDTIDAARRAEDAAWRRTERELRQHDEDSRQRSEDELRRRIEQESRHKIEDEVRRRLEDEARKKLEDETRHKIEDETRKKVEDELRRRAEVETRARLEEEARRRIEDETRQRLEDETRRRIEDETRQRLEDEARRRNADAGREAELRRRVEEEMRREMGLPPTEAAPAPVPTAAPVAAPAALPRPPPRPLAAGMVAPAPPEGIFDPVQDVATVLAMLWQQQVTGRVDFTSQGRQKTLFLERGLPVDGYSTQTFDRIEEYLLRENRITRAQYQEVRVKGLRGPRRVAAFLATEGYLKPEELFGAVRGHLQETVFGLFEWEEGAWVYVPERSAEQDRVALDADPRALVLEGIRRKYLLPRMLAKVGGPSSIVTRRGEAGDLEALRPSAAEREVARLLDGTRSLEDVVFSTGQEPLTVYHLTCALCALGLAEVIVRGLEGAARAGGENGEVIDQGRIKDKLEQVRSLDYFTMLGVTRTATPYEIDRAYEHVRGDFHPARFSQGVQEGLRDELSEIEQVLGEARLVLRDERLRDAYARHLPG